MKNSNSKKSSKNPEASVLERIFNWEKLGVEVHELEFNVYYDGQTYHGITACLTPQTILVNGPGVEVTEYDEDVVTLDKLAEAEKEGILCKECVCYLEFSFMGNTGSSFDFQDVDHVLQWANGLQSFRLKENTLKGIAKSLPKRSETIRSLDLLSGPFKLPGVRGLLDRLHDNLEAFDGDVKAFYESSEGLNQILKHAARKVFQEDNGIFSLPTHSADGKNDESLIQEAKKLKKSLNKKVERFLSLPFYSLCSDPNSMLRFISKEDSSRADTSLIASSLNHLIVERWVGEAGEIVVVPYVIMLYIQKQFVGVQLEVVNLKEKPTERLLECMKAIHSKNGDGISFLQAYKAAVAID